MIPAKSPDEFRADVIRCLRPLCGTWSDQVFDELVEQIVRVEMKYRSLATVSKDSVFGG